MSSCFTYPSHSKTSQFRVGLPVEAFSHKPPVGGAVVPVPPLKRAFPFCVSRGGAQQSGQRTNQTPEGVRPPSLPKAVAGRQPYHLGVEQEEQWFNSQVVGLKLNDILAFVKGLLKEPHRTAFRKDAKIALLHQFDSSDSDSRWCGASISSGPGSLYEQHVTCAGETLQP